MAENEKNIPEVEETQDMQNVAEVSEDTAKKDKPAKSDKGAKKAKKKEKKSAGAWKGFKSELKKIVWPTWKQVLKNSGIVVVIVFVCACVIGLLDWAFRLGFDELVKLFIK